MTRNLSEIRIPFRSDFGVVWILVIQYSDIHCVYKFKLRVKLLSVIQTKMLGFQKFTNVVKLNLIVLKTPKCHYTE